ncbi:DUF2163 domain-containing protein [Parasphingorhabdus sp.]|uniref:DUF2163 domain-containing protein n=1 Tax=Parasphingorhabdus sp. TaxID=2709688 RepID=UPI00326470E0
MSLDWLDQQVTTRAFAWRLEREDGVAFGFVSHDRDVSIDDFTYRAAPGMVPSTIALTDDLDYNNVEVEGVMTSAAITESDLLSGRWNGARLEILLIDWANPENEIVHLISGEFSEVVQSENRFRVEMLGPTSALDEPVAPLTSPSCRADFGGKGCKISLHRHQQHCILAAVDGDGLEFEALAGEAALYGFGELRWLTGENCGLSFAIMSGSGNHILLADQPRGEVKSGDRALLTAGCNKMFATCRDRFNNVVNFRGEPHLPGNDLLTRYPGA